MPRSMATARTALRSLRSLRAVRAMEKVTVAKADSLNVLKPDTSICLQHWSTAQIEMIRQILPHLRQFALIRHTLIYMKAFGASMFELLDNASLGVIQLDRHARIVAANDLASGILRSAGGLIDENGHLLASNPDESIKLRNLLQKALPRFGGPGASGSMLVTRELSEPRLLLHVNPAHDNGTEPNRIQTGALVLIVDPIVSEGLDPGRVGDALDLTRAESQVAILLAQGKSAEEIAAGRGRSLSTVRWQIQKIFRKHKISRQADLVRLVLSLPLD